VANDGPAATRFAIDLTAQTFEFVSAACPISGETITCTSATALRAYETTVYDIVVLAPGNGGRSSLTFEVRALDAADPVPANNVDHYGWPLPPGCQAGAAAPHASHVVVASLVLGVWRSARRRRRRPAAAEQARE
jgi:hypothetical protein